MTRVGTQLCSALDWEACTGAVSMPLSGMRPLLASSLEAAQARTAIAETAAAISS
jgi:hypothetical protein